MEQTLAISSMFIISIMSLTFILIIIYATFWLVNLFYYKRKEKYALLLLENGFEVVTTYKGVPHLLKKGKEFHFAWQGKNYTSTQLSNNSLQKQRKA